MLSAALSSEAEARLRIVFFHVYAIIRRASDGTSGGWGMSYDYLMTARRLRSGEFTSEPGPLRFIKISRDRTSYGAADVVSSPAVWAAELQGLADGDENPNSISPTGDVLIFVHGYNNSMSVVIERTRQLRNSLRTEGWRGEVIAFDWPSANQVLNYIEDRQDGAAVAGEMVTKGIRLLSQGQINGCQTNVHVLAHSAGCYVTMEAFVQAEKFGKLFKEDWLSVRSLSSRVTSLPIASLKRAIGARPCSGASCD